jgi:lipopolysaccharide/colanic/teichoic acid biosynthesis glycosyltransferase
MRCAKRVADVVIAACLLLLLAVPMGVVAVLVRTFMGAPVIFRQERAGQNGVPFVMYKFRTMTHATGPTGEPLPDDQRLTKLGQFLRKTSLDELPELWNVLIGNMSLVGPRPLYLHYVPLYSPEQRRRLEAKPGITGWAQVNGRNALDWQRRFEHDVWYVDHWSPWLDAVILLRTIRTVLGRRGISAEGHVTMPEFRGSANLSLTAPQPPSESQAY